MCRDKRVPDAKTKIIWSEDMSGIPGIILRTFFCPGVPTKNIHRTFVLSRRSDQERSPSIEERFLCHGSPAKKEVGTFSLVGFSDKGTSRTFPLSRYSDTGINQLLLRFVLTWRERSLSGTTLLCHQNYAILPSQ
jgi:hypothetical protein